MKAPNFAYEKPSTLREAIDVLTRHNGTAVPIAGGQSLLAGLSMRLSSPEVIVDLAGLSELKGISIEGNFVRVGALTRHVELLRSPQIRDHVPLIAKAIQFVAHVAVRNRGTIGGSVAYADPAAELPACIVALGATVVIAGSRGLREVAAENFFLGLFETDLRAGDVIVEFKIPRIRPQRRWVFMEFSRRRGDFAMAGLAAQLDISGAHIADARLVYFGCAEYPRLAKTVAGELIGHSLPLVDFDSIAAAIAEDLDPSDSAGMRADTKLKLATVVTKRALAELPDTTTSRPSAQ